VQSIPDVGGSSVTIRAGLAVDDAMWLDTVLVSVTDAVLDNTHEGVVAESLQSFKNVLQ
jgi:hypothetical protein